MRMCLYRFDDERVYKAVPDERLEWAYADVVLELPDDLVGRWLAVQREWAALQAEIAPIYTALRDAEANDVTHRDPPKSSPPGWTGSRATGRVIWRQTGGKRHGTPGEKT